MHRRFGEHNRPSLSGPSIPCPRVETRDRHEAPLPVKTETGVLKKKGRQNNRYIGVLHRAGRNTPRTECPDKAKWFCSMSGHKRSLRAGPGSGVQASVSHSLTARTQQILPLIMKLLLHLLQSPLSLASGQCRLN